MKTLKTFPFKTGFDPEYFLMDSHLGRIVNAIPVLKRGKEDPYVLADGLKVYYDNTNVENTVPVSSNKQEVLSNLKNSFKLIHQKVLGSKYKLVLKAAHKFDPKEVADEESKRIGCTPSYNAWARAMTPAMEFEDSTRTTAAHIHVSAPQLDDFDTREITIRCLDVILGTSLTIIGNDEMSPIRKKLYGKAGEFRFGQGDCRVEYRVPDNFYLRSPETTELVYDLVDHTLSNVFSGTAPTILDKINENALIQSINSCDKNGCKAILDKVGLPNELLSRVTGKTYSPDFYRDWKF